MNTPDPAPAEDRLAEPPGDHEIEWIRENATELNEGDYGPQAKQAAEALLRVLAELDRQKTAYAYAVKDLLYQHKTERNAFAEQVAKLGLELNTTKRERDAARAELEAAQARLDKVAGLRYDEVDGRRFPHEHSIDGPECAGCWVDAIDEALGLGEESTAPDAAMDEFEAADEIDRRWE